MDAYLEFLNENANRRYPLVENCQAVSNLGWQIPNDLLLDAQITSRYPIGILYVSGWNSGSATLTLKSTAAVGMTLEVPIEATYPQTQTITTADPAYPDTTGVTVTLVLGPAATTMPSGTHLFGPQAAPVEPSAIVDLSNSLVNLLGAIRADNPDFLVEGDTQIAGGYYTRATQDQDVITVITDPLGGQLGPYTGTGDAVCGGVLFTINGQGPGTRGQVQLIPGAGITITAVPSANKVIVAVDTTTIAGAGCVS